jgi:hypothetical protein
VPTWSPRPKPPNSPRVLGSDRRVGEGRTGTKRRPEATGAESIRRLAEDGSGGMALALVSLEHEVDRPRIPAGKPTLAATGCRRHGRAPTPPRLPWRSAPTKGKASSRGDPSAGSSSRTRKRTLDSLPISPKSVENKANASLRPAIAAPPPGHRWRRSGSSRPRAPRGGERHPLHSKLKPPPIRRSAAPSRASKPRLTPDPA